MNKVVKRDTITLSSFIRKETRELEKSILSHRLQGLRETLRLNALYDYAKYRRGNHKKSPKLWPLREHAGDFSQSLDRFINLPYDFLIKHFGRSA